MSDYCSKADVEARFGTTNVATWASLAEGDDAAAQVARVAVARTVAQAEMDDILRCKGEYESKLPLDTVPTTITEMTAIRTGLWLYTFRAADDMTNADGFISWVWKYYRQWIDDVQSGRVKLDIS